MRSLIARIPPPILAGILIFVMAFALYSFTTQPLTGYEPETGAVTEGLVTEGRLWDNETSPLPLAADIPGRGEHRYSRTGIVQPLLEAPFFAAGHAADKYLGHFSSYPNGYAFLWFYNPFIAALAAVALFALVLQTRGSLRWASAIATLFTVASIAWPYSKIGMETTFMFALIASFALGVWARRSPSVLSWSLTGFATGATMACKPYAMVSALPIGVLLLPTFLALERRDKARLLAAAAVPVLLWIGVIGWYNWWRFGSISDFGYGGQAPTTKGAAVSALGLLLSPGKGLALYSPLVVVGALGLPRLWRADRTLAVALLTAFLALLGLSALSTYWGDEVWGPRYIVPVSWVLLVPLAWWGWTVTRQKVIAGVAVLAVAVQVIGVSAQYAHYTDVVRALTGVPIYQDRLGVPRQKIPYGNDPTRWIPELSALVVQTEGLISSQVVERVTGGEGLTVTYAPFEGRTRTVNLSEARYRMPLDFWWYPPPRYMLLARGLAFLILAASIAAGAALYLLVVGRRRPWAPAPVAQTP